jgi:hypothetical protein
MEPAMALATMRAIASEDTPDALPTVALKAQRVTALDGRCVT